MKLLDGTFGCCTILAFSLLISSCISIDTGTEKKDDYLVLESGNVYKKIYTHNKNGRAIWSGIEKVE